MAELKEGVEAPKIVIEMRRADQITDVPFDNPKNTVIVTDYDFTVKVPGVSVPGMPIAAVLRGGETSLQRLQEEREKAWGLIVATARGPQHTETVLKEMTNVYVVPSKAEEGKEKKEIRKISISKLLGPELGGGVALEPVKVYDGLAKEWDSSGPGFISEQMVLNDIAKAAGVVTALQKGAKEKSEKIESIIFRDDYVQNVLNFPDEIMRYLNSRNLGDKLGKTIKIVCVWLDPSCEVENGHLKNLAQTGSENSFRPEYQFALKHFFPDKTPRTYTVEEFHTVLDRVRTEQNKWYQEEKKKQEEQKLKDHQRMLDERRKASSDPVFAGLKKQAIAFINPSKWGEKQDNPAFVKFKKDLGLENAEIDEVSMNSVTYIRDGKKQTTKIEDLYNSQKQKPMGGFKP